jgi:hypothetical protein
MEHEVWWKARKVALHRLDQGAGFDAVQVSEIRVEDHLVAAEYADGLFDTNRGNQSCRLRVGVTHAGLIGVASRRVRVEPKSHRRAGG